jgi:hypothetical protein
VNFNSQVLKTSASQMATARYVRETAPATILGRSGHPLRLAMILQIPVGYETGVHRGEPRAQKSVYRFEPADDSYDTYKF